MPPLCSATNFFPGISLDDSQTCRLGKGIAAIKPATVALLREAHLGYFAKMSALGMAPY
jgi:hypothetical protein